MSKKNVKEACLRGILINAVDCKVVVEFVFYSVIINESSSWSQAINSKRINFGEYFNQHLEHSLGKIIELHILTFGENFNQQLDFTVNFDL